MMPSKRSVLAAAGIAGLATLGPTGAEGGDRDEVLDRTVAELVQISEDANAALMRGDTDTYRRLLTLSDDFTLMAPFGGTPTRGADITDRTWTDMARFFKNGSLRQELVQAYASADMVVLAVIEHNRGEVGGLPAQDWALRVTLVYRRVGDDWHLAHRHADPLVAGIGLDEAAALARR